MRQPTVAEQRKRKYKTGYFYLFREAYFNVFQKYVEIL